MKLLVVFLFLISFPIIIFGSCPSGSIQYHSFCYIFISKATQFPDAELTCNGMNGSLASIHDGWTNAVLTSESTKYFHGSTTVDFWIGLNSLMTPGKWSWTDNTTFDFKERCPSQPQNLSMSCSAVTIQNGCWSSADCFKTKPYVCELQKISSTVLPTTTTPSYLAYANCTPGWLYFEPTHSCYGHDELGGQGAEYGHWTPGEQYCKNFQAHLTSIHCSEEALFLSGIASIQGGKIWTGLTSNYNEMSWTWSDDSPKNYLPWASGHPNRSVSSCAYLWQNYLYDADCLDNYFFICKKLAPSFV